MRIDLPGGIAGDMFVAACADAWPDHCHAVLQNIRKSGFPDTLEPGFEKVMVNGFTATRFLVGKPGKGSRPSGAYGEIVARLKASLLPKGVLQHALAIFEIMGRAEAGVHGKLLADVHFHELADWDSQADIVAAASFIDALNIRHWSCGSLPLGGGTVKTEHGMIAVPAPAVLKMLEGFDWVDDGISGERVTPTGAAILSYLVDSTNTPSSGSLIATGSGAGTRRFDSLANLTRLVFFADKADYKEETICRLSFEIDDMTPEELAVSLDHIRAESGVLDASHGIRYGKKGRIQFAVRILCRTEASDKVVEACFCQTTTLAVRKARTARTVLARHVEGPVKIAQRPHGKMTAKAESDSIAALPSLQERRTARLKAENAAIKNAGHSSGA